MHLRDRRISQDGTTQRQRTKCHWQNVVKGLARMSLTVIMSHKTCAVWQSGKKEAAAHPFNIITSPKHGGSRIINVVLFSKRNWEAHIWTEGMNGVNSKTAYFEQSRTEGLFVTFDLVKWRNNAEILILWPATCDRTPLGSPVVLIIACWRTGMLYGDTKKSSTFMAIHSFFKSQINLIIFWHAHWLWLWETWV